MKWLAISFPRWLENDLRTAPDIVRKSVDLALQLLADVRLRQRQGHPSRAHRRERVDSPEEIEASDELFEALSARM